MKIWNTRLSSTEERIIELKQEIANKSKELAERLVDVGVSQGQLDGLVKRDNTPLKDELEMLATQRQFILDRRNGWKQKLFLIAASAIMTLAISRFFSGW